MKTIMVLMIGFFFNMAQAFTRAELKSFDYVSWHNFGMPTLKINTDSEKNISIVVQQALLSYSNKGFNVELRDRLSKLFDLENLNSFILEFRKTACIAIESTEVLEGQVMSCNRHPFNLGDVRVRGAVSDLFGEVLEVSEKTVSSNLAVDVTFHKTISATGRSKFLQANVGGQLFPNGDSTDMIFVSLTKEFLGLKN